MAIGWMYNHFAITVTIDSAKQWYDWFGVGDRNCFWLAETFTKMRPKTTLAATASFTANTATSNVSGSCANRTMVSTECWLKWAGYHYWWGWVAESRLSVFDETTKWNHETKWRNRWTIIRGLVWWALYKFLYFTKWDAGLIQNGTRLSYMFAAVFSRFKPC